MAKPLFLVPINGTAARVVSGGTHYVSGKKVATPVFETRPPLRAETAIDRSGQGYRNQTGTRRGRLVVVGLAEGKAVKWVARCDCGVYVLRSNKAIRNEANETDACPECSNLMYIQRRELFKRSGKDAHLRDFV